VLTRALQATRSLDVMYVALLCTR